VGREAAHADGEEQSRAKVKTRHSSNGQLEAVVCPYAGGASALSSVAAVEHVDEAVLCWQKPRRRAAPQCHDDQGDRIVDGDGAANAAEQWCRKEGVSVDDEADADADVRVVDIGEVWYQPGVVGEDVALEAEFDVDVEEAFETEDL
jgi:hypothetical protein